MQARPCPEPHLVVSHEVQHGAGERAVGAAAHREALLLVAIRAHGRHKVVAVAEAPRAAWPVACRCCIRRAAAPLLQRRGSRCADGTAAVQLCASVRSLRCRQV